MTTVGMLQKSLRGQYHAVIGSYMKKWRIVRQKAAFKRELARMEPKRIIVGAGGSRQCGWLPTDRDTLDLLLADNWMQLLAAASLDAILAEHVWEHLSADEAAAAAAICFNYLKPGGYLRVAVPDGYHPDQNYIDHVKPSPSGYDDHGHQQLFTYHTIRALFAAAGFDVVLYEYFDENGNFHESQWDHQDGMVCRSRKYDKRNAGGVLHYTSIILDAYKPGF